MVSFKRGGLAVRCHAWDRNLGGRDIDELLYDHFCKEVQEKHRLDVRSNAKASFKLRTQCQRIKKVRGWVWSGGWAGVGDSAASLAYWLPVVRHVGWRMNEGRRQLS